MTHVVGTEISTALSSTAPSSTAPSSTTPSLTLSLLPSKMNISLSQAYHNQLSLDERLSSEVTITVIAISSVLIGIILALTFFCFVSVVVWKQRRR